MSISVYRDTRRSFSDDKGLVKTATVYYTVKSTTPLTEVQAETASGVPIYGQPHDYDSTRIMIHKRPQCIDPDASLMLNWSVQCDYSNENQIVANPLTQPGTTAWSFAAGKENYFFDLSNPQKVVVNSAGEPFEKNPEREKTEFSATWTKNVPVSFSLPSMVNEMDTVNAAPFFLDGYLWPAQIGKISGGSLGAVQTVDLQSGATFVPIEYRVMTCIVKFDGSGNQWQDYYADRGYNQRIIVNAVGGGTEIKLQPIVWGVPPTAVKKPFPLDGSGNPMPNATDVPAKLGFQPYYFGANWGIFGFV